MTPLESLRTQNKGVKKSSQTPLESFRLSTKSTQVTPLQKYRESNPPPPPTLLQKAGTIGKELIKAVVEPVATMVARPIQLGAELLGASDESVNEFTKKHFGDWVAPTPQNMGDLKKDVGRGIQTALTGGLGTVGKTALGMVGTKVIPSALGKLAATGAIEGAGFGLGASMEQGNDILSSETAKNVILGTGLGAIAPVAIKGAGRILKGKAGRAAEDLAIQEAEKIRLEKEANLRAFGSETRPPVPEAGQPPLGYINPKAPKQLEAPKTIKSAIELPEAGILDSQAKLRTITPEVPVITKTPLIKEAETFASKNDYVTYKNTDTWQNTKDAIDIKKQKKTFGDVWEEAHTTEGPISTPPVVERVPVLQKTEPTALPTQQAQPIKSALPTVKDEITNRTIERLNQEIPVDVTDEIRQYQKTTNQKQVEEVMTHDFAFQKDVALGRKQPPTGGAPATAYRAHLENIADDFANKGDTSLAEELSKTKIVKSEMGAGLQATQIASKDSLTAILSDVRDQMVKKIPRGDIKLSKLTDDLKVKIAATKQVKPTRQILRVILDNIKCK